MNEYFITIERDAFGNYTVCIATSTSAFADEHGEVFMGETRERAHELADTLIIDLKRHGITAGIDDTTVEEENPFEEEQE
jgi:hypothetical protein